MNKGNPDPEIFKLGTPMSSFASKKNRVVLLDPDPATGWTEPVILKSYPNAQRKEYEACILDMLAGKVPVPQVLLSGVDYLVLSYVRGDNLADWLQMEEAKHAPMVSDAVRWTMTALLDWLVDFYTTIGQVFGDELIMGDINLRNFLVGEGITGIDFEDVCKGDQATDIGGIAAFILTYDPGFTPWKHQVVAWWIDTAARRFNLERGIIEAEMDLELQRMQLRRA